MRRLRGIVTAAGVTGAIALAGCAERGDRDGIDAESLPAELEARVVDIVDGDTIKVELPGGEIESVRYIGIDTPESVHPGEPVQCYAKRASRVNERLVAGRVVSLRFDAERRDRYGRLLAYVHRDGTFVNALLVRRGLARTLTISPNDSLAPLFERLEAAAGRAGRGLWGAC